MKCARCGRKIPPYGHRNFHQWTDLQDRPVHKKCAILAGKEASA